MTQASFGTCILRVEDSISSVQPSFLVASRISEGYLISTIPKPSLLVDGKEGRKEGNQGTNERKKIICMLLLQPPKGIVTTIPTRKMNRLLLVVLVATSLVILPGGGSFIRTSHAWTTPPYYSTAGGGGPFRRRRGTTTTIATTTTTTRKMPGRRRNAFAIGNIISRRQSAAMPSYIVLLMAARRPQGPASSSDNNDDFGERKYPQKKKRPTTGQNRSFSGRVGGGGNRPTPKKGRKGPKPSPEDERILKMIRAKRIEDAIDLMGKFHQQDKAVKLQLNTFHSVFKACSWSRRRDAGLMANNGIEWMQKYEKDRRLDRNPHCGTYSMAINAWSKSNHPDSGKQAEDILDKISSLTKDKPTVVTYSAVITAWSKQGNPIRAERLFERMVHDSKSGNPKAKPNVLAYSSLMDAWARSNSEQAGEKCESLLDQMVVK